MRQVAIIGGGIIGATAAFYLSFLKGSESVHVTLYDDGTGQATKAASGIISPWLSKRRNKRWYALAKRGAELLPQLVMDANLGADVYQQTGTIVTRKDHADLLRLYTEAQRRAADTPAMGDIVLLTADQVGQRMPFITNPPEGVFVSGGAKIDGSAFVTQLLRNAESRNLTIVKQRVKLDRHGRVIDHTGQRQFDNMIIATGAWMKDTLAPLGVKAAIRPQKGQLIDLSLAADHSWMKLPVLMPEGSSDIIPFANGKLVIGATHEDDGQFDLTPTQSAQSELLGNAKVFINTLSRNQIVNVRVGTRTYTPDFGPFFGSLTTISDSILVGGGLGSSGLTTGPIIGYLLAKSILQRGLESFEAYTKPVSAYIH